MAPEETPQPSDNNDEHAEAEDWPELTSIAAIIQRARIYAAKHHCAINLSFHVELTGMTKDQVKEKFIFSGSPGKGTDPESALYKKVLNDIKNMVTEEMQAAFHGSVQDLDKDELEALSQMEDEVSDLSNELNNSKPDKNAPKPKSNDGPFMDFKGFSNA
jgi:hypothetical protein